MARTCGTRLTVAAMGADTAGLRFLEGAEDLDLVADAARVGIVSRTTMRPPDFDFWASAVDW